MARIISARARKAANGEPDAVARPLDRRPPERDFEVADLRPAGGSVYLIST